MGITETPVDFVLAARACRGKAQASSGDEKKGRSAESGSVRLMAVASLNESTKFLADHQREKPIIARHYRGEIRGPGFFLGRRDHWCTRRRRISRGTFYVRRHPEHKRDYRNRYWL